MESAHVSIAAAPIGHECIRAFVDQFVELELRGLHSNLELIVSFGCCVCIHGIVRHCKIKNVCVRGKLEKRRYAVSRPGPSQRKNNLCVTASSPAFVTTTTTQKEIDENWQWFVWHVPLSHCYRTSHTDWCHAPRRYACIAAIKCAIVVVAVELSTEIALSIYTLYVNSEFWKRSKLDYCIFFFFSSMFKAICKQLHSCDC